MRTSSMLLCLIAIFALTVSCAPAEESESGGASAMSDASADNPLSGTWTGDWGPTPEHRNAVTLELSWDEASLSGTVNPGPNGIELDSASFDPATGAVMMEASATNFQGAEVHYMIEGQLAGDSMSGSWTHDASQGTFTISRN